jgi:hypothetical protein
VNIQSILAAYPLADNTICISKLRMVPIRTTLGHLFRLSNVFATDLLAEAPAAG